MNIDIRTIPHKEQRYDTAGDYTEDEGLLTIRVSKLGEWKMDACMAIHELVEALLCKARGIKFERIDEFDKAFEERRAAGLEREYAEPGLSPESPYFREHIAAMKIEECLADELGISWSEYSRRVDAL